MRERVFDVIGNYWKKKDLGQVAGAAYSQRREEWKKEIDLLCEI